ANTTMKNLTIANGATLNIGANDLTVTGSLDAGHTIVGSGGSVLLTGVGSIKGKVNASVFVNGSYALAGADTVSGNFTVGAGGLRQARFNSLAVGGNFGPTSTGYLSMPNAAGIIVGTGDVSFGGATESGNLTAGVIQLSGNFSQTGVATSFAAGVNHAVHF